MVESKPQFFSLQASWRGPAIRPLFGDVFGKMAALNYLTNKMTYNILQSAQFWPIRAGTRTQGMHKIGEYERLENSKAEAVKQPSHKQHPDRGWSS